MGANYVEASHAKVVLNPATVNEAIVKGMNAMTLPGGVERNVLTIEEFGRDIDTKLASGGAYADLSFKGNMVKGDTKGQDQLKEWNNNNTKITAIRFHMDTDDFVALDLANDSEGFFQVSSFLPDEAPKSGIFTIAIGMIVGGRVATYTAHKVGTELSFVSASRTITSSSSDFLTAGFAAGQTLIIEGSPTNDGSYIIESVIAGTITLTDAYSLTSEAGDADTAIHGGK